MSGDVGKLLLQEERRSDEINVAEFVLSDEIYENNKHKSMMRVECQRWKEYVELGCTLYQTKLNYKSQRMGTYQIVTISRI